MKDLIAQLEAAEVGSRELDHDIEMAIEGPYFCSGPAYTISLDAAMKLADAEAYVSVSGYTHVNRIVARVRGSQAIASTPALALCAAALKARTADHETEEA